MRKNVPGIKWKIFTYLISFCLMLLVILALFQTVFLERFYIMIKQNEVKTEIASISTYVETSDWEGLTAAASEPGDIFVEVWSMEKGLVQSSGTFQNGIHTQLSPSEMEDLFTQLQSQDGSITRRYRSESKGRKGFGQNLVSAQLMESTDGSTYVVLVSAGLSPVNATVDTLRVQLVYISVIMLLLSVGLALLISRKISKPIVSISRSASELGKGNYHVVFRGSGYHEVIHLADILTDAASELSKTEELRQELISNVSHDLRTPLTLISGYSEMIRDMPDEATPENMQIIIDETNRLSLLVNDLLDLSKLQAGTDRMHMERFDLAELTEEIAGRVARFCEQDGYIVKYQPTAPVYVKADRERISQVIYNFLLNAITHTGPDKQVSVQLNLSADRVKVEISDTGKGISLADQPHIWERYYKVDKSHGREKTGSGLGLSIVKSILERHANVEYGVETQPGNGSTFWFSMLCDKEEESSVI